MPHVSVTINGRQYRMACDDGQEHHLARLAHELDQRIARLRTSFGEIGDMRLTVMAALLISDELAETSQRMRRFEEELAELQQARVVAAEHAQKTSSAIIAALNAAAERIERVTTALNAGGDGHDVPAG
ncbi:MAG: cell division protein ZapA [Rhodoplanes sp.]|jgi:cell division protein ZapA|nr:cell division protein ZapA [Rhodoplanes sp.]